MIYISKIYCRIKLIYIYITSKDEKVYFMGFHELNKINKCILQIDKL